MHQNITNLKSYSLCFFALIASACLVFPATPAQAQEQEQEQEQTNENTNSLPTVTEFTSNMVVHDGFYRFYHDQPQGRFYLAIPKKSAAFILQTSLPWGLGSNDIGLDRGQLGATRLVEFLVTGQRVLLQQKNTDYRARTDQTAEQLSVEQAFTQSVIWGFDVVAASDDTVLIDYTPFLLSDTHGVADRLAETDQGTYQLDTNRSALFPERSKAFPDNTELEAKVTFHGKAEGDWVRSIAPDPANLTVHLHHSLIRLPDDQYQTREFHPNSGFWAHQYLDYAAPLGEDMRVRVIPRHRLTKKNPDAAMSEAVEPIVYYLDPGVPEPVRSALLDGAMWWNEAFTAIGYENAFQVKELPADADPMDVRYNVIQWVHRATRGWSYGSSIIDPRTGEILKGHVTLGSLRVRQDMLIAQGLLAPYGDSEEVTKATLAKIEAMALARIRQLSAHEIGHTLGIAHNFAASANDRASVMDYPHPLVSLSTTNDGLSLDQAYTDSLGIWDKQVVAYGYGDNQGIQQLATILRENRALGLQFISDRDARPTAGAHPDAHLWDNGSDPVTELERILGVRATALEHFGLANLAPGQPVNRLHELLVPIYALHRYQVEAAVKMLGGTSYSYYVKGEDKLDFRAVNGRQQKLALVQLLQTLEADQLRLPKHIRQLLVPLSYGDSANREQFKGRTGLVPDPVTMAEALAGHTLNLLLEPARLNRLAQQHQEDQGVPSPAMMLDELYQTAIAPALNGSTEQSVVPQRVAYRTIYEISQSYQSATLAPEVRAQLLVVLERIQTASAETENGSSKAFAKLLHRSIEQFLAEGDWPDKAYQPARLPPGSPI